MLHHLNALVESGRLNDVAVDTPPGLRITGIYTRFRHLYDDVRAVALCQDACATRTLFFLEALGRVGPCYNK